MEQLEGKVKKIIMQNQDNNYTICLIDDGKFNGLVSVVGHFPIMYINMDFKLFGKWKDHQRFGKQFVVDSFDILMPKSNNDLLPFLTSSFIDCPITLACEIERKIGIQYLEIFNDIDLVNLKLKDSKFDKTKLGVVKKNIEEFIEKKNSIDFLTKKGLDQSVASKIVFSNTYTNLDDIKENPYNLISLYKLDWDLIDNFAQNIGFSFTGSFRYKEGIKYLLNLASENHAHMYLPIDTLVKSSQKFLTTSNDFNFELSELEKTDEIVKDGKGRVYLKENYIVEKNLAEHLYRIHKAKPYFDTSSYTIDFSDFPYGDKQKEAIETAFRSQVCIISGPAGTGKSTIVKKIVKTHQDAGFKIKLCAPTGRAAKRLKEVTGKKAVTAHLLLGFHSATNHPMLGLRNPIEADCIIVDEASMLDIKLARFLVEAIKSGAKLIIIGDPNQLPSVGPGTVLKDLLDNEFFPKVELDEVYRQSGGVLLDVATKIRKGESVDFNSIPSKSDFKLLKVSTQENIKSAIGQLVNRFMANKKYDILTDLQIISPINNGPIGVKELNKFLQNIINPKPKKELKMGYSIFRTGDKIVQNENNYDKKLFNGDIGFIVDIDLKSKTIIADFDGFLHSFSGEEIFNISLAYCSSVHKAQGGEYKFVIMPLHESYGRMINRKILYTGGTRAKTAFISLSTEELFNKAISKSGEEVRYSTFVDRLKEQRLVNLLK